MQQHTFLSPVEGSTEKVNKNVIYDVIIDIERQKLDCFRFVMCPLLALGFQGFFFLSFLVWPLTVLIKQTRQAGCTIKQSIFLDVYGCNG